MLCIVRSVLCVVCVDVLCVVCCLFCVAVCCSLLLFVVVWVCGLLFVSCGLLLVVCCCVVVGVVVRCLLFVLRCVLPVVCREMCVLVRLLFYASCACWSCLLYVVCCLRIVF